MKSPITISAGRIQRHLSASDITKTALNLLKLQLVTAWRQTNLTVHRRKGIMNKGVSDILGYTNSGQARFVACEVKTIGDTLSDAQHEFLSGLSKSGGLAFVATQVGNRAELIRYEEYIRL